MKHLMIDLETLGTSPGCVVHELAAVSFDPATDDTSEFYLIIDIESSERAGLTISATTLKWWNDQGGPRQDGADEFHAAMKFFKAFLDYSSPESVWSWGSDFDLPILRALFKAAGLHWPLKYWTTRDARTVWDIANPGVIHPRAKGHNALDDCRRQISQLKESLTKLKSPLIEA